MHCKPRSALKKRPQVHLGVCPAQDLFLRCRCCWHGRLLLAAGRIISSTVTISIWSLGVVIYFWWLQALTALLGGAFALGFLPETRDKTFTQLENIFSRNSGEKELVWIIVFGITEINVIKFPNRSDLLLERWRCKDDIELFRWRITLQMDCFFFCLNCPEIYRCCQLQAFFVSYIELFTWNERCSEQISQVALFWRGLSAGQGGVGLGNHLCVVQICNHRVVPLRPTAGHLCKLFDF